MVTKMLKMAVGNVSSKCYCNIIRQLLSNNKFYINQFRNSSTSLKVPTFCELNVNMPCNISVKHLDLHLCDSNKIIYNVINGKDIKISHKQVGDKVYLNAEGPKNDTVTCEIQAPIKANLTIKSTGGDIDVGPFDSENVQLTATNGHVVLDKYIGKSVIVETTKGDVKFNNVVQAKTITVRIADSGTISTNRLQGIEVNLKTKIGDITVESSYCNNSEFTVDKGNLSLSNIHKDCKVHIREAGSLKMTGFDGKLQAYVKHGDVDIQLSQVLADSSLEIEDGGNLTLRLSEECQANTSFEINAKKVQVEESVGLIKSLTKNVAYLTALNEICKNFIVKCRNSDVEVKSASWADMLFAEKVNKSI